MITGAAGFIAGAGLCLYGGYTSSNRSKFNYTEKLVDVFTISRGLCFPRYLKQSRQENEILTLGS
jgi:hypothetical protein